MLRHQLSAVAILLFVLSACTQASSLPGDTATAPAPETPANAASSVAPIAATLTPGLLPTVSFSAIPMSENVSPTDTPTAVVLPSNFSPILLGKKYDSNMFFVMLGGVQDGQWISVDQAVANIAGAAEYDVYAFASGPQQAYGYAPQRSMPSGGYFLSTDSAMNETGMIGVVRGWQVAHRVAEELPSDNEMYQQIMIDWLSEAGIDDPQLGTMHIYRIDLEGDGTDEIFISDTRVEGLHGVVAGDHSVILLRKVIANGVVTIPILADLYAAIGYGNPFPCSYSIANFVDLNQDGVLEVMAAYDRWEGFGASVYEVQGETVQQVLGTTCINP